MKFFVFVQLLITVVIFLGVSKVRGKAFLTKRVDTLEMRVNSIEMRVNTDNTLTWTNINALEQEIEFLNISLSLLEYQICPSDGNAENQRHSMPGKSHSRENDDVLHLSKNVLLTGFADEKKWLRDKAEKFRNETNESLSVIKRDINTYKTELDVKYAELRNETDKSLLIIKSDIKNFKTENEVKAEELQNKMDESLSLIKSDIRNLKTEIDVEVEELQSKTNERFSVIKSDIRSIKTEIDIKAEELQNKRVESLSVIKSDISKCKTEFNVKLDALASEKDKEFKDIKKRITDETESARKTLTNLQNELNHIDTRMTKTESTVKQYQSKMNKKIHSKVTALGELITGLIDGTAKCPKGWTRYNMYCYLYVSDELAFLASVVSCLFFHNAVVAEINSQAENDFLVQLAGKNGHKWKDENIWIGITYEDDEGEWSFLNKETKPKFMNMRSGQPDGGTSQNCMVMGLKTPYDKWNDWDCDSKNKFICKKKIE